MTEKLFSAQQLKEYCIAVLSKAGLNEREAIIVSESLLFAEVRGIRSHGIVRLETYLERVNAGVMNLAANMRIERDSPASALLDADNGFGQVAGVTAMALAIEKAENTGVALVAVKNSNHFGIAAFFAMQALRKNMIGLVFTNASPAMALYGSKVPLVGTNPLAVAVPAANERPVVLDMSTSVVARGKIRLASKRGEKIPISWALDSDGRPTDDPIAALKGSMAPIAGPKGSGLSLVIDLLCGVLTGSSLTGQVRNVTDLSGPAKTGHIFIAISVAQFGDAIEFKENVDTVIQQVKSLPSVDGTPAYLPGEIEADLEKKYMAEGISLRPDLIATLDKLSEHYGVHKPWRVES